MIENAFFCAIRKKWMAPLPEELIRQNLIVEITQHLGFPIQNLKIETSLSQIPHLLSSSKSLPTRRADLICFYRGYPLLLIECKAVKLNQAVIRQVVGYNHFLKAPFIAIANDKEKKFGWFDKNLKDFTFISYIPPYAELIKNLS